MTSGLGLLDWALVALLVLAVFGAALALSIVLSRRHTDDEVLSLRNQLRLLQLRVTAVERQEADVQPSPPPTVPLVKPPPLPERVPEPAAWPDPEAPVVRRTMETLTQDAARALASLDAFRRFARAEGGSGFVIASGSRNCQPVSGNDPVSTADLWAVPFEGGALYFPGYNLRRTQSALLADAGRTARDRLGWLFDIETGDQLAAFKPAFQRSGEPLQRGLLTLPFG